MGKEMEWWLTEPERKTLMAEINALTESKKARVMDFMRELIKNGKPP